MNPVDGALARVRSAIERNRHLGIQLYASVNGKSAVDEALGEAAPGTALRREDAVPWVCSTKLLGAVAMAQLMGQRSIGPETPVADIVPEFAQRGKRLVSIAELMSHAVPYGGPAEFDVYGREHAAALTSVCETPLDAPAGSGAQYSALRSWVVVAEMVARLADEDYADYVRRRILAPLEMTGTVFGRPAAHTAAGQSQAPLPMYEWPDEADESRFEPTAFLTDQPGVGGHGPAYELARIAECLVGRGRWRGRRVLEPEAVDLVTTVCRSGLQDAYFGGLDITWGMGACTDPLLFGAPRRARVVGHTGSNCGLVVGDLERGLVVVHLATNEAFEDLGPGRLESRVVKDLYGLVR